MPHDYAKKPRSPGQAPRGARQQRPAKPARKQTRARSRRTPASTQHQSGGLSVRWILSLAAVGGFIGFIVYLNSLPPASAPKPVATTQSPQATKPSPKKSTDDSHFRFYDILPESKVVPQDIGNYDPGPEDHSFVYMLQTGSFRHEADAERQRAQIAFQGLRASVDRIAMDDGSAWYRVNVGPFDSRTKMNAVMDKLVSISIEPLAKKVPKSK